MDKSSSQEPLYIEILKMDYNPETNLFKMKVKIIKSGEEVTFALKGTDFDITPDVPSKIIEQFCTEMIGKKKNLFIEFDNTSLSGTKKDNTIFSPEDIEKINSNMDNYPISELRYEEQKRNEEKLSES